MTSGEQRDRQRDGYKNPNLVVLFHDLCFHGEILYRVFKTLPYFAVEPISNLDLRLGRPDLQNGELEVQLLSVRRLDDWTTLRPTHLLGKLEHLPLLIEHFDKINPIPNPRPLHSTLQKQWLSQTLSNRRK